MSCMKVAEKFTVPEPEWILDTAGSGPWHWRRESSESKSRVRFRFDVEVKEFQRAEHEFDDKWPEENPNIFAMSASCIMCIAVTVILPWYLFGGFN